MDVPTVKIGKLMAARDQSRASLNDDTRCLLIEFVGLSQPARIDLMRFIQCEFGRGISYNVIDGSGVVLYVPRYERLSADRAQEIAREQLTIIKRVSGLNFVIVTV